MTLFRPTKRTSISKFATVALLLMQVIGGFANPDSARSVNPIDEVASANQAEARMIDIGDRQLFVQCQGTGSPRIILLGGYGGGVDDWRLVQPFLAERTSVCAYDRAGVGKSDAPIHQPTGAEDNAHDLHMLLLALGASDQVILVGFSAGGLLARYYSAEYPEEVMAIVLIDPTPPTWPTIRLSTTSGQSRTNLFSEFSGLNKSEPEQLDILGLAAEVMVSTPPSVPVLMLTSGIKTSNPGMSGDQDTRTLRQLQDDQARDLGAYHVIAQGCNHYLPSLCSDQVVSIVYTALQGGGTSESVTELASKPQVAFACGQE
jgi:alpha/beta hydrolase fold